MLELHGWSGGMNGSPGSTPSFAPAGMCFGGQARLRALGRLRRASFSSWSGIAYVRPGGHKLPNRDATRTVPTARLRLKIRRRAHGVYALEAGGWVSTLFQ